jgi:hypothetical protein
MSTDDDDRATTRMHVLPDIFSTGPRETVAMPALTRPEPTIRIAERTVRPPDHDDLHDDQPWQTGATRVELLTRPDFERAIRRLLRAVYVSAALFALSVAFTAWLLR